MSVLFAEDGLFPQSHVPCCFTLKSVVLWDWLLQLFLKYVSLFFPLLHLKASDYKVAKVQGVCFYYSVLQGPNRACVAFYVHDCIRWFWKDCGTNLGETSTQHPVVGPDHLSGRHMTHPSSFNHGGLQWVLCSSMVLQETAFAAQWRYAIANTNLPGLSLLSATLNRVFLKIPCLPVSGDVLCPDSLPKPLEWVCWRATLNWLHQYWS